MALSRRFWGLLETLLISVAVLAFAASNHHVLSTLDSLCYTKSAEAMLEGRYFRPGPTSTLEDCLLLRTPGYPALMAAAQYLFGGGYEQVFIVHFLSALFSAVILGLAFRRWVPILGGGACALSGFLLMRYYFSWVMTEWTAFCLLLIFASTLAGCFQRPSSLRVLALSLLVSLLVLVRPALIVILPFPAAVLLLSRRLVSPRHWGLMVLGLLPVVAWMGGNYYRISSFSLTPHSGYNLIGVATSIGYAETREGDPEDLAYFIREVNRRKIPPVGESIPFYRYYQERVQIQRSFWDSKINYIHNYNTYDVALPIRLERGWPLVRYNELLFSYFFRTVRAFPAAYLEYVMAGLSRLKEVTPLLLPGLLLPLFWRRFEELRPLALTVSAMFLLHLMHVFMCSSIEVLIPRYWDLTFAPLLVLSAVITLAAVYRAAREETLFPSTSLP